MRNYQNKLTKNNIFIDDLRNHGIVRLIIDELEKYVVLTLKNWGGGGTNMYIKKYFLELKRIFISKQISMILSKLFILCNTCKRRLNELYLFFVSKMGYVYPLN